MSGRRIAFVLGKRPRRATVTAEVIDLLHAAGFDVSVHLPHDDPRALSAGLGDVALVVHRGLDPRALEELERAVGATTVCNPIPATRALGDRLLVARRLEAAGLPVPPTVPAATWADVVAVSNGRSVVVKDREARRGRGAGVAMAADGGLPRTPPFDGPYVVQDRVSGDGFDRKLYLAGRHLRGLLKPGLERSEHVPSGIPFRPSEVLAGVGDAAGRALGLEVFGVDAVVGEAGPQIVDVNPFPGFRGVPGAAGLVACHLGGRAGSGGAVTCRCADPGG